MKFQERLKLRSRRRILKFFEYWVPWLLFLENLRFALDGNINKGLDTSVDRTEQIVYPRMVWTMPALFVWSAGICGQFYFFQGKAYKICAWLTLAENFIERFGTTQLLCSVLRGRITRAILDWQKATWTADVGCDAIYSPHNSVDLGGKSSISIELVIKNSFE